MQIYKKIIFYLVLFFPLNVHIVSVEKDIYIIGNSISYPPGGFFFQFFAVLNQLEWCERNNKVPVVYWGNDSLYFEAEGYNGEKNNVWEYYFEQVSDQSYPNGHPVSHSFYPDTNFGIYKGASSFKEIISLNRRWVHILIKKFIHIKPIIMQKIEDFFKKNMENKFTIGIHMRGTDKQIEVKPVEVKKFFDEANKIASQHPVCQFFVATDEEKLLEAAIQNLRGKVIFYDALRSSSKEPLHYSANLPSINKAKLGEDVLIDAQLLSRCNILIHANSNVAAAVLFFNDHLEHIFLEP